MTIPRYNMLGPNADGPLTGRINFVGGPALPPPQPFDSGWQAPQPAAATPLGHGGTQSRKPLGLDPAVEAQVANHLIDALDTEEESDIRNERNLLFAQWEDVNRNIRRFLRVAHDLRVAELRRELEEVRALGREKLEEVRQLAAEANAATANFNDYLDSYSRAKVRLKTAEAEKPDSDTWPTDEEMAAWRERVANARDRAERADARHTELRGAIDFARARVAQARRRLQELRETRERLAAQIDGRPYKGPHGLIVPGSGT